MQDYAEAVCAARELGTPPARYRLVCGHGCYAIVIDENRFMFPPGTTREQAEWVFDEARRVYLETLN